MYKLIFMGSPGVGKTSVLTRIASDEYKEGGKQAVIFEAFPKISIINEEKLRAQLFEIKGSIPEIQKQRIIFNNVSAVVLLIDPFDPNSMAYAESADELASAMVKPMLDGKRVPFLILVTKQDRCADEQPLVSEADISELSKRVDAPVAWVSAKTGDNVLASYEGRLSAARQRRRLALQAAPEDDSFQINSIKAIAPMAKKMRSASKKGEEKEKRGRKSTQEQAEKGQRKSACC